MICYKDMTFCGNSPECGNVDCDRKLTERDKAIAQRHDLPIAQAFFKDTEHCPGYIPVEREVG